MGEELIDEILPDALAGQRIDRVVSLVADLSRGSAGRLVHEGRVSLDGLTVEKPSIRVAAGSRLRFVFERPSSALEPDGAVALVVLHEDADVVVIDKPAGLVVHPGAGLAGATLANGLLARYPEVAAVGEPRRPGIVHRLDKGTSGALMVARTERAHRSLSEQLRARTVERRYHAVVHGHVDAQAGLIDAPLGRSPRDPAVRAVVADGRPARTRYEVEGRGHLPAWNLSDEEEEVGLNRDSLPVSRLRCRLETGRTHQIRAHLAAIGHPVVADDAYGGGVALGGGVAELLDRPHLHAQTLAFDHPASGERLRFHSPLPDDLRAVRRAGQLDGEDIDTAQVDDGEGTSA